MWFQAEICTEALKLMIDCWTDAVKLVGGDKDMVKIFKYKRETILTNISILNFYYYIYRIKYQI